MRNRFNSEFPGFLSLALGLLFATPIFAWESGRDDGANENVLVVVDANQKIIGNYGGERTIVRNVNGRWVSMEFNIAGFGLTAINHIQYAYQSVNCTGTKYLYADTVPTGIVVQSSNNTNTLYFPGLPVKNLNIGSLGYNNYCMQTSGPLWVGPAQSVNIDNYKAPFIVESASQVKSEHAHQ